MDVPGIRQMTINDYLLLIWHFAIWSPGLFAALFCYVKLLLLFDRFNKVIKWVLASLSYAIIILIGLAPLVTSMGINRSIKSDVSKGHVIIAICFLYVLAWTPAFIYIRKFIPQLRRAGYLRPTRRW